MGRGQDAPCAVADPCLTDRESSVVTVPEDVPPVAVLRPEPALVVWRRS